MNSNQSNRPAWAVLLFVTLLFVFIGNRNLFAQSENDVPSAADAAGAAEPVAAATTDSIATDGENASSTKMKFGRREALMASLTIFVLAVFVGFELITKVPPTLHTPLMSGSNAISGVTLVGAVLVAGSATGSGFGKFLGMLAVAMAGVNCVGGFMVTDRMLSMFKKKG